MALGHRGLRLVGLGTHLAAGQGVRTDCFGMETGGEGRAVLPVAVHREASLLAGADGTPAEPEGGDVRVPLAASGVEERVSSEAATSAIIGGGGAGGAALTFLYDGVGAVGGRTHYGLTINLTPPTAAHLALVVGSFPSVPLVIKRSFISTLFPHTLGEHSVPNLFSEISEISRHYLQVIPGVSR